MRPDRSEMLRYQNRSFCFVTMRVCILTIGILFLLFAACSTPSGEEHEPAGTTPDQTEAVDPAGRGEGPGIRRGHAVVYDVQREQVLLFGGHPRPEAGLHESLWSWKGQGWQLVAGGGPGTRTLPAVAFDARRGVLVVHGGIGLQNQNRYGDTWEWDGEVWEEKNVQSPGTRDHHALAYDEVRGRVVMFGGQGWDRSFATDTWEWDGTTWIPFEVSGPGGRAHHAMVYDAARRQVLLFGGIDENFEFLADTWVWDGLVWQQVATEGPPPRARHRMAFDKAHGEVVLLGGSGVKTSEDPGFNVLADTWVWDGESWMQREAEGPGKKLMHAMTYDEMRQRVILYGGGDGESSQPDLWAWDGATWTNLAGQ